MRLLFALKSAVGRAPTRCRTKSATSPRGCRCSVSSRLKPKYSSSVRICVVAYPSPSPREDLHHRYVWGGAAIGKRAAARFTCPGCTRRKGRRRAPGIIGKLRHPIVLNRGHQARKSPAQDRASWGGGVFFWEEMRLAQCEPSYSSEAPISSRA